MNIFVRCFGPECANNGTKYCKGCKLVPYCSDKCMHDDWPNHKNGCRKREDFGPDISKLTLRDFYRKYLASLVGVFGLANMFETFGSKRVALVAQQFIEVIENAEKDKSQMNITIVPHDRESVGNYPDILNKIESYDPKNEILLVIIFVLEHIDTHKKVATIGDGFILATRGVSAIFIINKKGGVLPHGNINNL